MKCHSQQSRLKRLAVILLSLTLFQCGSEEDPNSAAVKVAVAPATVQVRDYDLTVRITADQTITINRNFLTFGLSVQNGSAYKLTIASVQVIVNSPDGEVKKSLSPSASISSALYFAENIAAGDSVTIPDPGNPDTVFNFLYTDSLYKDSPTAGTNWSASVTLKGFFGDALEPAGRFQKTVYFTTE